MRAEEERRREQIRATLLPDASKRAEIDAALAASRDLERERIAALEQSAGQTDAAREAEKKRKEVLQEANGVIEATRTAAEKYAAEIDKLNRLLASGAIDQETYARAVAKARAEMEAGEKAALAKATDPGSGVRRAIDSYLKDVSDASKLAERFTLNTLNSIEDAIVKMATTGKLEWKGLVDAIVADLIRLQARQLLGGLFSGLFGGSGGGLFGGLFGGSGGGLLGSLFRSASSGATSSAAAIYHPGGLVGDPAPIRLIPVDVFRAAPRLHEGAYLRPDEVPAILQRGERVLSRKETAALNAREQNAAPIVLTFNVTTPDAGSFRRAQGQITAEMASALERARRNL